MIHTASNDLTVSFCPVLLREEVDFKGRRKMMRPGANMGMMSLFFFLVLVLVKKRKKAPFFFSSPTASKPLERKNKKKAK